MGGHRGGGHGGGGRGFRGGWGGGYLYPAYPVVYDDLDPFDRGDTTTVIVMSDPSAVHAKAPQQAALHGESMFGFGDELQEASDPLVHLIQSRLSGVDNDLSLSTGGMDPFAVADFGGDDESGGKPPTTGPGFPTEDMPEDISLPEAIDPWAYTMEDTDYDPMLIAGRTETDPDIRPDFGGGYDEFYSSFGPAPLMNGEATPPHARRRKGHHHMHMQPGARRGLLGRVFR